MSLSEKSPSQPQSPAPAEESGSKSWLTIVGIGEDGWEGLTDEARNAIDEADVIIGGERHLSFIDTGNKETKTWGKRLKELVGEIENLRGRKVCVLASGNPLFYGVGSHFTQALAPDEMKIIPRLSILTQVCARMNWAETELEVVTLCGRPLAMLNKALFDGARLIVLCAGENNPAQVANRMCERGFGMSKVHVFDYVGGRREARASYLAHEISPDMAFSPLNTLAVECVADKDASIYSMVPGLPNNAFDHDGQITKAEIRAITLARLSPRPDELLWDIGAGAGSIGIEWMRAAPRAAAIAIETREDRAARIKKNADALGVPRLDIRIGEAPEILSGLPTPNAIFIGGGLTRPGMLDACWRALPSGGRLVANTVTIESEAILVAAHAERGGDLTRISINRADPVGRFLGWRPAMPVTQWAIIKP